MKILITTDLFTVTTNGVVTSTKNLHHALTEMGHDVRILTLSANNKSKKEDSIYYVKSAPLGVVYPGIRVPLSYRNKLISELVDWKPDVIHSQCEFFSYQFALRVHKKTGAPIVHTYHTMYEEYVGYVLPAKRLGKWAVKIFIKNRLKKVSAVIVPTTKVKNALLNLGVKNELSIVPSGICLDQHKLPVTKDQLVEKKRELGIPEGNFVMINLGRMATEKKVDELITFYTKAVEVHPNLTFLIVGDGPAKDDFQKLSIKLGLENKVIFTGRVDPKEVHEYYKLGDLFVSASVSETQGLTYVEAMANGLPLLCRKDDCLDEVLIEGQNGYTYQTEQEFLSHLTNIINDNDWQKQASEKSLELSQKYDRRNFALSAEKIYQSVLQNKQK